MPHRECPVYKETLMHLLALNLISDPKAWIIIGLMFTHIYAFTQGRHFEQRKHIAGIEAANKRVKAANAKEDSLFAKEEVMREKALVDAQAVITKNRYVVTEELAGAMNRIR